MTCMEAWHNISRRLGEYEKEHGWTHDDIVASVMAFQALKEMEKKENGRPA